VADITEHEIIIIVASKLARNWTFETILARSVREVWVLAYVFRTSDLCWNAVALDHH
jgi:hypothetical protein